MNWATEEDKAESAWAARKTKMPCFVSMAGETAFLEVGMKLAQDARIISGQIPWQMHEDGVT